MIYNKCKTLTKMDISEMQRSAWIGATKDPVTGQWIWTTSHRSIHSFYDAWWGPYEPSGDGDCAVRRWWLDSGWNDIPCDARPRFFCEFHNGDL